MTLHLIVSMTEAETRAAMVDSPRRDFLELAERAGAAVQYRRARPRKRSLLRELLSPPFGQAWAAAGRTAPGDVVYADQEVLGLWLLAAIALRRRRPERVVILAHLPGRVWKRAAFWVGTRLGVPGRLIVHSVMQASFLRPLLSRSWELRIHPYQVDTTYWRSRGAPPEGTPVICAVGAEHRDYRTLVRATEGLPVRVVIAAGSNWARRTANAGNTPANVEYIPHMLPYTELRELYERATLVVVPVGDVPNQSGITTLLEAMSMERPIIATANRGQREAIRGPLVRADGSFDCDATADRGPFVIVPEAPATEEHPNGLYVPSGDAAALRAAIERLLADAPLRSALARAARADAERWFSIERFADRFAASLREPVPGVPGRARRSER